MSATKLPSKSNLGRTPKTAAKKTAPKIASEDTAKGAAKRPVWPYSTATIKGSEIRTESEQEKKLAKLIFETRTIVVDLAERLDELDNLEPTTMLENLPKLLVNVQELIMHCYAMDSVRKYIIEIEKRRAGKLLLRSY